MAVARVEVFRTHDPSGVPAPLTEVHEIWPKNRWQTVPDAVEGWIRPMCPSRTSRRGVYLYDSPEYGKGRMTVSISGALYRERMDEKVQMLEIERVLGCREPGKVSDTLPWMYPIRLQARNPYLMILIGAMLLVLGCMQFLSVFANEQLGYFDRFGLSALGLTLASIGVLFFLYPGLRRVWWWHRARAEVKRRGDKMPFDLLLM